MTGRHRGGPRRRPQRPAVTLEVTIDGLGSGGDGLARAPGGGADLFVPLALPGERWRVRAEGGGGPAVPLERLADGPVPRAAPPCPHFGACGGCRLQHLPADAYAALKLERVRSALRQRGLDPGAVEPVRTVPLRSRRRLRLALTGSGRGLRLGFRRRASRDVVPVDVCPIALPELEALLGPLAAALGRALGAPLPAELSLAATAGGVDALLHADRNPTLAEREALAALAGDLDLARIAWARGPEAEAVAERRPPVVTLGGVGVVPPPAGFLQATTFAEAELALAVLAWGGGARRVLDLYAGLGTLGLPLAARGAALHAVEADRAVLDALRRGAGRAGLSAVTVEARDLDRRPLEGPELDRHDLVLLDPPRAGALPQAAALARSRVRRVVYAACDPATFARDARVLADAGFHLAAVRPIDQFLFSPEIELVARLDRDVAPSGLDRPRDTR